MNTYCNQLQERLAERGRDLLRDDAEGRRHIESCHECAAVLAALEDLDAGFAALSVLDASDELADQTLSAVRDDSAGGGESSSESAAGISRYPWSFRMTLAASLAAGILGVAVIGPNFMNALKRSAQKRTVSDMRSVATAQESYAADGVSAPIVRNLMVPPTNMETTYIKKLPTQDAWKTDFEYVIEGDVSEISAGDDKNEDASKEDRSQHFNNDAIYSRGTFVQYPETSPQESRRYNEEPPEEEQAREDSARDTFAFRRRSESAPSDQRHRELEKPAPKRQVGQSVTGEASGRETDERLDGPVAGGGKLKNLEKGKAATEREFGDRAEREGQEKLVVEMTVTEKSLDEAELPEMKDTGASIQIDAERMSELTNSAGRPQELLTLMPGVVNTEDSDRDEIAISGGSAGEIRYGLDPAASKPSPAATPGEQPVDTLELRSGGYQVEYGRRSEALPAPSVVSTALSFLAARNVTDGLTFQPAIGYWENTYTPGDPAIRLLEARLKARSGAFQRPDGTPFLLEAAARTYEQPFDAPEDSALSVFLSSDRTHVDGPTRMLVQVGIQGTERRSGRRPAMNIGVVLDLREEPDDATAAMMRSLMNALVAARETGDRISLIAAGRAGRVLVAAEDFRHGPVTLAMQSVFGDAEVADKGSYDLYQAVQQAQRLVAATDDPTAPLGASLVLLITPSRLHGATGTIAGMAHQSAVDGIPMSVIGVGPRVAADELDRIALSGQGHRRLLTESSDAESLVDHELHATSRVIARAVRLRIRLDSDVQLVSILGSERLEAPAAERVRQAEQSIDQRMSRNLGIRSDRGEDEAGIQIVIPAFYAGDSHVILLDVVASKPGHIADVTARYKDLVHLRNNVARTSLRIRRRPSEPGPLERNVTKNLVAHGLSEALDRASVSLRRGRVEDATTQLAWCAELLSGLSAEIPDWAGDSELASDLRLVNDYLALIQGGAGADPTQRQHLADSLQYSSTLKVMDRQEHP